MDDKLTRHKTFQIRGYCRRSGYLRVAEVLQQCITLYNAALQERRDAYRMQRVSITRVDQMKQFTLVRQDLEEWRKLDVTIGRGVLCRVDRAFQAFFRRIKASQNPGFPRFRSRRRYSCIELSEVRPSMVKTAENGRKAYVRIKGLPTIILPLKQPLPDSKSLRTLRINLRDTGLDVDLVYALPTEAGKPRIEAVGIDMGVNQRLTLSNGDIISPSAVDRSKEENLRRAVGKSRKGSNRRRKRVAQLRRECRRNRVRNRNACHRITSALVKNYGTIAVEDLRIRNMTASATGTIENPGNNVAAKSGLNRSILEQTWGIIRNQLRYKAEWAGTRMIEVNSKNTSRTCSRCDKVRKQKLEHYRTFNCFHCGLIIDRDLNAAINILKRALALTKQGGNSPAVPKGAMTAATAVPQGLSCM